MFGFVLSLAVLSAMLAIISGAAIIYRKTFLKGREGYMYPLWIFILLLSVMPLRLDIGLTDTITQPEISGISQVSEISSPSDSSVDSIDSVTVIHPRNHLSAAIIVRRAASALVSKCGLIANVIFVVWLVGATIRFTFSMNDYRQAKKLLLCSSYLCKDQKLLTTLNDCRRDLGLRRKIQLRMIESEGLCSPCVCGLFSPVLYLEPGCMCLSDTELRCVIAHELTHVKRQDMLLKLFTTFVTSVHWFNPVSGKILRYVYEDCELACDNNVIRTYGNSISGDYMTAILDFAERFSERRRLIGSENFDGGFFFAKTSNAAFLKRRYANMKNFRKSYKTIAISAAIAITMGAANLFALSSCGGLTPGSLRNSLAMPEPIEMMLRAYYGLSEDDFITSDMLDGIETLTIKANKTIDGHVLADFTVNGESGYTQAVPTLSMKNYWDACVQTKIDDAVAKADETAYYNDQNKLVTATFGRKIKAFYALKDLSVPELSEGDANLMRKISPDLEDKGALYVFDPYSTDREIQMIYQCFDKAGLLDPWEVDSDVFDASFIEYFPNLTEVSFIGFTPVNCELTESVSVSEQEYDSDSVFDVYHELKVPHANKVYSDPLNVEYKLPDDGSTIVLMKNDSLFYALREYFALQNWNLADNPLTSKEAALVKSIKAELVNDNAYNYVDADPYLFANATFVRYTINGTELPLIPLNYAASDFENLFGGIIEDEKAQEILKNSYVLSEDSTRYTLGEISDEDELYLYKMFTERSLMMVAVVGDYEIPNEIYKFEFQSPSPRLLGTPARFISYAPKFDESDKDLFPNLEEWDIEFLTNDAEANA